MGHRENKQLLQPWSSAKRQVAALCAICAAVLGLCSPAQATIARSGTLQAIVTDNFRTGESNTRYSLRSGKGETEVVPTELAAEPGDRVVVTGSMRDGRFVGSVEAVPGDAGTSALAAGPRKVAVLLVTFPGGPDEPWSPASTHSKIFTAANSVNAFYEEESYGGISLTGKLEEDGDVFGWLNLETPTASCPYNTWKAEADEAAAGAGIDLTGYQHIIYMFPHQSSCFWAGAAMNNWAMINGNLGVQTITHELGHNLGLLHAGSWTCTSGGVRVQISDSCTISEYGDPFDAMGNIAPRHNNGWNLAKLGILAPGNVETVDASGAYSMRSALQPTAEPTVLRIPRTRALNGSVTSWYYLEVRESGGVFENVTDASTTGVSIRATAANSSPETLLLDANPATFTFQDAPLGVGRTFDAGPVAIKTLAAGGGSATVSVELDEEPPTAPTDLTATAGFEEVQLAWTPSTDDFGVSRYVVFRDGVEVGASASANFLDSPVPVGDYEYVVYAEDVTGNRSVASEPVPVTVEPDEEPPTAPTDLIATGVFDGVQLAWDASTDNFGVERYLVFRDGARIESSAATGFLDSFSSAGDHTYVVYAVDVAGNQSAASEPVTTTVPALSGPACGGGVCTVTFRHSGTAATWTVPPGVGEAEFTVEGARGGSDNVQKVSGRGARGVATLGSLTTGEEATVNVGGAGKPYAEGGAGGFNGGGDGTLGGGGGGFSSVELDSTLMLLAGGGGGDGLEGFNSVTAAEPGGGSGGRGGQLGTVGSPGGATDAQGATLDGGDGGASGGSNGAGGAAGQVTGTSTCPGNASAGAPGVAGDEFVGGGGASGAGGGGGGGYVGGGQGGGGARDECGSTAGSGGGGGGSSFAAPGLSAAFTSGIRRGSGRVSIAYADPISAGKRSYTTEPDHELIVPAGSGVLSTASGPSGVPLTASVETPPAHGLLTLQDDGSFTYIPASGYFGGDSFAYRAGDPSGNYATAQVALTVAAPPSALISAPPGGRIFALGQVVPTAFACSEGAGGTGLSSCDDSTTAKTKTGGAGRLDTATIGLHTYTVTALSKDGLWGDASISYTVVPPVEPPDKPKDPPGDPEEPPLKIDLSLGVERKSQRELLRTGGLVVIAEVNETAKVALVGSTKLEHGARRKMQAKSVAIFKRKTVSFAGPGKKRVMLVLSRKGREELRRLSKLRLSIAGKATDVAGETATRRLALTLQR
ncbi:MAG TPA: Ig-like domain-containing protein [Solirubrobacterales bacterium]